MAEIKEGLKKWLEAMGEDKAFSQKFVELEDPKKRSGVDDNLKLALRNMIYFL